MLFEKLCNNEQIGYNLKIQHQLLLILNGNKIKKDIDIID